MLYNFTGIELFYRVQKLELRRAYPELQKILSLEKIQRNLVGLVKLQHTLALLEKIKILALVDGHRLCNHFIIL